MKIKVRNKSWSEISEIPKPKHKKPARPSITLKILIRILSIFDLVPVSFKYKKVGMDKLRRRESCLILMNHSGFIDLKIASKMLFSKRYHIVATYDAFMGKPRLMRAIGCIPTQKFVTDLNLIRDIDYAVKNKKSSILMFPEAGYSFDGKSVLLPDSLGWFVKRLGIPVVTIITSGAFARDPLYNGLQKRKVKVSAEMKYLLSPEEASSLSPDEINSLIRREFDFDGFAWQRENKIRISEKFRADHLERLLYKCPACKTEGKMRGEGIELSCSECGKSWLLDEYGEMIAQSGDTEFSHIPDWFSWQRDCVRKEITDAEYSLDCDVDIYVMADSRAMYKLGDGKLRHTTEGFRLSDSSGELDYRHKPTASHTVCADFYWYEIGDVISFGTYDKMYYCIPKEIGISVSKVRLAAEEIYKLSHKKQNIT